VLRCPDLPAPFHLLAAVLDWDALALRDRLSVFGLARALRAARRSLDGGNGLAMASPGETVERWLELNGQTRPLCEWLWYPLAVAALNQSPGEAAAPCFVRVLAGLFGRDSRDAAIGVPAAPLHLMYAEPARGFVTARGGDVRVGAPARIVGRSGTTLVVEWRGERLEAPAVISAVPWHALPALVAGLGSLPAGLARTVERAAAMVSLPIVTVNLWYDRPVMDEPFLGLHGRTLQWVFDKRFAFGEGASHLSTVVSGASAIVGRSNEALEALAAREVAEALPQVRGARLLRATTVREKRATFSLAPGQPARPATLTDVPGLILAGDWLDTGLPGTIESAVVSGHRAADAVR
jgi:squalene-associated FAD-dependent desaturase